jgi:hypothetical protein
LVSLFLRAYQKIDLNGVTGEAIVVDHEENLSLNEFLTYYKSGDFDKIKLVDDTNLL